MAKRRPQKRAHAANGIGANAPFSSSTSDRRIPKSMVIRTGGSAVGPSVSQLVQDVRSMMEPHTAARLKERRKNKLRDYTTMAGPLGVSHLLLFSRSERSGVGGGDGRRGGNVNLRLAVTPRGPTLTFRVEEYSLCKDVHKSQKRPRGGASEEFKAAPLLVMNNFSSSSQQQDGESTNGQQKAPQIPKHLESLTTTIFQSLFPPINPTNTPLKGIKRVLLLDRTSKSSSDPDSDSDAARYILNLRHYAIETRTAKSVPKPLRRLDAAEKPSHTGQKRKRGGLPNLGKLDDVADFLLDPQAAEGFTSGSDSEPDTDAEVEVLAPTATKVPRNYKPQRQKLDDSANTIDGAHSGRAKVEKKGIKLHELGPRLKLRLTKVEEGLCTGRVMWHEYIHKSEREVREMEKVHEERNREGEARKAEQRENVERKRKARKANGADAEEEDEEEWDDYEDDEIVDGVAGAN